MFAPPLPHGFDDEDGFLPRGSSHVNDMKRPALLGTRKKATRREPSAHPETCVHLFMFQPSSAPGREGNTVPAAPAANAPTEGQPSTGVPAPASDGGLFGGSGLTMLLPLVAFVVIMLWSQRSQAKKQKAVEEGIKVGERVVTTSGIVGKVIEVGERTTRVEIAPGVHVTFLKTAIQGPDPTSAVKKDESKKDESKKDDVKKDDVKKDESSKKDDGKKLDAPALAKSKDKDAKDK